MLARFAKQLDALPERVILAITVVIAVAAALARWRAVDVGLMSDDYAQHAMLRGLYPGGPYAPFDLYAFFRDDPQILAAHVEAGTVPWWTTADLHGSVMRPLASALRSLDYALWSGRGAAGSRPAHVHSLVWLVLLIVSAGLALVRALPRSIALTAVVILACEAGFATPLGWLANRCSLVSATFVCLAVWAHLGWRPVDADSPPSASRRAWLGVELLCVGLALAAGEYGLAAPASIVGLELLRPGSAWRERARAAAPALALALVWLVLHRALGYGTTGSAVYVDPLTQPIAWLAVASERLPRLLAAALWGVPADSGDLLRRFSALLDSWAGASVDPAAYLASHTLVAGLLVALAAVAWLLVRPALELGERRTALGLGLGALLALVPLTVAPAHTRLLVGVQLGVSTLAAAIIVGGVRSLGRWAELGWVRRGLAALALVLAATMAYAQTVAELRWGRAYLEVLVDLNRSIDAAFEGRDLLGEDLGGRELIVVNAAGQTIGLHGHYWLDVEGWPAPRSWRALAMAEFPIAARRVDDDTLELAAIQAAWLRSGAELFFRRQGEAMPAGTIVTWPGLVVEVTADDGAGHPTQIEFSFPASLDDPRYLFVMVTPKGLRRWRVPAVGAREPIPRPRLPVVTDG